MATATWGFTVEFGLLGPLEIVDEGRAVAITATRQRVVLATLLLNANRPVTVEHLIEVLWADAIPPSARVTVQNYIRRLRTSLSTNSGASPIETIPEGYRIVLDADQLDLLQFEAQLKQARSQVKAGALAEGLECYRAGLALWRGQPLPDLAQAGWLPAEVASLTDLHLMVTEEWAEIELATGAGNAVIGCLKELVARWPLREPLRAQLMRALHAEGRTAEALTEYTKARNTLIRELGVEPGRQLLAAHQHVLAGHAIEVRTHPLPSQLPPVVAALSGRGQALAELDHLVDSVANHAGSSSAIVAISGTAGVGKTTLAVHWAQRVAHRFPDGQLYVNLRGYDPVGPPLSPDEVSRAFLTALGVAEESIPEGSEAQTALFRSAVTSRRVLILLDNASSAEQVRPLLPGLGESLVVVTSRAQLPSLTVVEGARPINLDLLTEEGSLALLSSRLGAHRVDVDLEAAVDIVARCARLPLALSIAAARASNQPNVSLRTLADQLADPGRTSLDVLRSGDRTTDVREVLSWSTDALDPEPARLFRLLGLHPGPDFTPEATAHLIDRMVPQTHGWLDDLARAQLLIETKPGRYSFHDLLRAHAMELADRQESHDDQTVAIRRLFDHLVEMANISGDVLDPPLFSSQGSTSKRDQISIFPAIGQSVTGSSILNRQSARAWLSGEDRVLSAAIVYASRTPELESYSWLLTRPTGDLRTGSGRLQEDISLHERSLAVCLRQRDRLGEATVRSGLGSSYTYLGNFGAAERELQAAHDIFRDLNDHVGHASLHLRLGSLLDRHGNASGSLDHGRIALRLFEELGHELGVAIAHNDVGWCLSRLGQHENALAHCLRSLAACREIDLRTQIATSLDSLGRIYLHLGRNEEAIASYVEAVALMQEEERHLQLAEYIWHLGDAYDATGDPQAARSSWQSSLDLLEQLDHPNAAVLRTKLSN